MRKDELQEFPYELGFKDYYFTNEYKIYRLLKSGRYKELKMDSRKYFKITKNDKKIENVSNVKFIGIVDRINGKFKNRRRLAKPFQRYEVTRRGEVFYFHEPERGVIKTTTTMYKLMKDDGVGYKLKSGIELVSRYFSYSDTKYHNLDEGVLLTRLKHDDILTTSSRDFNGFFVSQQNTIIVPTMFKFSNLYLPISDLPIFLNLDTRIVYNYKTNTEVPFDIDSNIKTYRIPVWNFKDKRVKEVKFLIQKALLNDGFIILKLND